MDVYLVEMVIKVLFQRQTFSAEEMWTFPGGEEFLLSRIVDTFSHTIAPEIVRFVICG